LTTTFDASQSDRINNFHPSGELFLEFTNGKWTFVFQPQYSEVDLDGNLTTPLGDLPLEIRTDSLLIEYWGARRFGNENAWVEALFGGRYVKIKSEAHSPIVDNKAQHDWHD